MEMNRWKNFIYRDLVYGALIALCIASLSWLIKAGKLEFSISANQMKIFLILFGTAFLIFGILVVFSKRFLALMQRTLWKQTELGKKLFPGRARYIDDKYITGIDAIVFGLIALISAIFFFK